MIKIERTVAVMQRMYRQWLDDDIIGKQKPYIDITKDIDEKIIEIAGLFGFGYEKLEVIYIIDKEERIVAWHNDHGRSWGPAETGFDILDKRLFEEFASKKTFIESL